MPLLDWPFLDALQAGALAALCANFFADAVTRRDRMMGWLALTCLLVGLRHLVLALGSLPTLNSDLADRAQSLLVVTGFLTLCAAVTELFPRQIPRAFPLWVALAQAPAFIRNLILSHPSLWDTWLHHASNLVYLLGCGAIIYWSLKARQEGDPMGRRLFLGFVGVTLPVVVEVAALSLFGIKIRLSGFSLVVLAMAIGTSWQWLVVNAMEGRIHRAEHEVEAWRSLVPGQAFRTDRPSPVLEQRFGPRWAEQLRSGTDARLTGHDGLTYRMRSRALPSGEHVGWYERDEQAERQGHGFLSGWRVGLGLDNPQEQARLQALLQAWGADVQVWGTVPPREGPYPSVLVWAREPSILSVWREDDLLRRRPRWVQIGGPQTEGPHVRLDPGPSENVLRQALERLVSRG